MIELFVTIALATIGIYIAGVILFYLVAIAIAIYAWLFD